MSKTTFISATSRRDFLLRAGYNLNNSSIYLDFCCLLRLGFDEIPAIAVIMDNYPLSEYGKEV